MILLHPSQCIAHAHRERERDTTQICMRTHAHMHTHFHLMHTGAVWPALPEPHLNTPHNTSFKNRHIAVLLQHPPNSRVSKGKLFLLGPEELLRRDLCRSLPMVLPTEPVVAFNLALSVSGRSSRQSALRVSIVSSILWGREEG